MTAQPKMRVHDETLDRLHELKERGESYEDVVNRLIDFYEEAEGE